MFKHYGLKGQTIRIRQRLLSSTEEPWMYDEQKARVEAETPYFIVATILPHYNPNGFGISQPYRTTIHKHDIESGRTIINGGRDQVRILIFIVIYLALGIIGGRIAGYGGLVETLIWPVSVPIVLIFRKFGGGE